MCGLNGIFAYNGAAGLPSETELLRTRDYMKARGPDGFGSWWSPDRRLALGHRRLSIIDLSSDANQPLSSDTERYTVVFNGEIYNYQELRSMLQAKGVRFRTKGDTEVLLQLYAYEGAKMVTRLRGMFAFAIWDNDEKSLFLARDPYGIKPLYTSNDGWYFRFASQAKAIIAGGGVSKTPEPAGAVGFYLWGSVPEPFTIYRDIRSLPAGHTQYIDASGPRVPEAYASIAAEFAIVPQTPPDFRDALLESVRCHLVSDVEVGLFLSSGVDSGALLGLMRDAGQRRIRAITVSFEEFDGTPEDEVPLAAEMARHYGAEHTVRRIGRQEFEDDVPAVLEAMDQPTIDGFNTFFASKAAREAGLKVALSGVGGDEILGGYESFRDIPLWVRWLRLTRLLPGLGVATRLVGMRLGLASKSPKGIGLLEYGGSYPRAYLLRRALFMPFELDTLLDGHFVETGLRRLRPLALASANGLNPNPPSPQARVASLESTNYLRNQLLRDSDWAGMAHGVEIRTPLVDFTLLQSLRASAAAGQGKRILASAPSLPVPNYILTRSKTGFVVPMRRLLSDVLNLPSVVSKGQLSRHWSRRVAKHFKIAGNRETAPVENLSLPNEAPIGFELPSRRV
jgi:asparagine synthase (glutamine-hydrolysing)